jgi:membrane-associated phospholipid phosphatase
MVTVADAVSLTFVGALVAPMILWLWTRQFAWAWLLGGIIAANGAVAGLKEVAVTLSDGGRWALRPAGAFSCGAFCEGGAVGGEPGFPSGHATTVAMFVGGAWSGAPAEWRPWIVVVGGLWIIAMGWSRMAKRCHTPVQVVVGTVFGLGLAAGGARLGFW